VTQGLTYSTYVTQIATLAVVSPTDTNFVAILPQTITYAENRIYRDVDFLFTSTSNASYSLASGNRQLSIPQGTIVVSEQMNIITPAGTTNPELGARNACLPVTKEFLDTVYGDSSYKAMPTYFAPFDDNLFLFGPFPDANYTVEIVGTVRPASLSATNTTTFLSTYLPDLMIMASMIYVSGYQRNFGKASEDPAMAVSYESSYQSLLKGAMMDEARKSFTASAWTSQPPAPVATPTRG
jgi:hypothetical protein